MFWQIAIVAFIEGVMFVLFNIAEIAALRSVVPPQQMAAAAAGEQARLSLVESAGPPLGGLLLGGPFLHGRLLRRPSRFLSGHRPPPCFGLTPAAAQIPGGGCLW